MSVRSIRRALHAALLLLALSGFATSAQAAAGDPLIGPAPAWVKPVQADTAAEADTGQLSQGVHYLLSDQQLRIEGRDKQAFRHFAMKAVNENGVQEIANVEIRFDPSYQTLTLHQIALRRGGRLISKLAPGAVRVLQREKELDALIFDGSKTAHVFLDDVRVGDTVEYAYTLQGTNPVFGGRQFGQFDLQWAAPVHQLYARLLWPSGRPLTLTPRNTTLQPRISESGGFRDHEWQARQVPALVVSKEAPASYDPYPGLQWGEFPDWAAVAQWAAPLYPVPRNPGGELGAEIRRIAEGFATPQERTAETLRYVQRTVRYLGVEVGAGSHAPNPPATVLARRFGDCKDKTLLTVTMLNALGIAARPALVNTKLRRGIAGYAPSPGLFDHVIVRAQIGDTVYWLDPTKAPQPGRLDLISQSNYDQALIVDPASRSLAEMPASPATLSKRQVRAVFDSSDGLDKPVRYTITTAMQGRSAENMRSQLASGNREELQKNYLNYYAKSYPSIRMAEPLSVSEEAAENRITVVEHYLIDDFWGEAEDKRKQLKAFIRVPEVRSMLNSPRDAIRQAPLAAEHPVELAHTTEVKLPEDWPVNAEGGRVADKAFVFERTMTSTPRLLTFEDSFRSLTDEIPAAEVPAYVANLDKVRDTLGYQLTKDLQPAAPAPGWLDRFNWSVALLAAGMLALWLRLALRIYRGDTAGTPAAAPPAQAIGGWLLLVGLGLVLTPFLLLREYGSLLPAYGNGSWAQSTAPGSEAFHPLKAPLMLFELAVALGRLVFYGLLLALFFRRRREFPRVFLVVGALSLLSLLTDYLAVLAMGIAEVNAKDWGELLRGGIWLAIWGRYLQVSERARATFVNGRPPTAQAQAPVQAPVDPLAPLPAPAE